MRSLHLIVLGAAFLVLCGLVSVYVLFLKQQPKEVDAADQQQSRATNSIASPRTETVRYQGWVVTCHYTGGEATKKNCFASFAVMDEQRRQILNWIVMRDQHDALVLIIQAAQTSAGTSINQGLKVKINGAASRKLTYTICAPNQCQAFIHVDDTMAKELIAAKSAIVTITTGAGQEVSINIKELNGADWVLTAIGA